MRPITVTVAFVCAADEIKTEFVMFNRPERLNMVLKTSQDEARYNVELKLNFTANLAFEGKGFVVRAGAAGNSKKHVSIFSYLSICRN